MFGWATEGTVCVKVRRKISSLVNLNVVGGIPWWSSGRTLCVHCRGPGFNPWLGSEDPVGCAVWPKNIKK